MKRQFCALIIRLFKFMLRNYRVTSLDLGQACWFRMFDSPVPQKANGVCDNFYQNIDSCDFFTVLRSPKTEDLRLKHTQ